MFWHHVHSFERGAFLCPLTLFNVNNLTVSIFIRTFVVGKEEAQERSDGIGFGGNYYKMLKYFSFSIFLYIFAMYLKKINNGQN